MTDFNQMRIIYLLTIICHNRLVFFMSLDVFNVCFDWNFNMKNSENGMIC